MTCRTWVSFRSLRRCHQRPQKIDSFCFKRKSLTGIIFSVLLVKMMKNNISIVYKSITFILAMLSQLFLLDFGPRATWENMRVRCRCHMMRTMQTNVFPQYIPSNVSQWKPCYKIKCFSCLKCKRAFNLRQIKEVLRLQHNVVTLTWSKPGFTKVL